MEGCTGKVLIVNLTNKKASVQAIPDKVYDAFLGGRGLAVHLLWDNIPAANTDPLGPDNPLIFANGPLMGFPIQGANRMCLATKSPLTKPLRGQAGAGGLSISDIPGHFSVELKFAGFDALIIKGESPQPVCLVINDDRVEFIDAAKIWGMDVPRAEAALRNVLKKRTPFKIALIGPAGENKVPISSIMVSQPYGLHFGRGGAGAVMGAKKLKAIAVHGTGQPFDAADAKQMELLYIQNAEKLKLWNQYEIWRNWGTASLIEAGNDAGLISVANFRESNNPGVDNIGAVRACEAYWVRSEACYYCSLHCKKIARIRGADGASLAVAGPELEHSVMLGSNCCVDELSGILQVKDKCDKLGIDPVSCGNTLGFLMECADAGLVAPDMVDGVKLEWGNARAMLELTANMATPGAANLRLGDGVRNLARVIGGGSAAWAMEVKGLELDTYNPAAYPQLVVAFGTNSVGGIHEMGHTAEVQDQRTVASALGLCRFHTYSNTTEDQAKLLSAITGKPWTAKDLLTVAERIWNLERAFLAREGFGPEDDRMPARSKTQPISSGPKKGAVLGQAVEDNQLKDYYTRRGWDPAKAMPTPATLDRLALLDAKKALYGG